MERTFLFLNTQIFVRASLRYKSSSIAVELAKKYNTRLHVFHISTEKELELFDNTIPLSEKELLLRFVFIICGLMKTIIKKKAHIKWNPVVKKE